MRIHHGAGYRVYFKRFGREWVILLAGGDKSTRGFCRRPANTPRCTSDCPNLILPEVLPSVCHVPPGAGYGKIAIALEARQCQQSRKNSPA